ncbi:MAG: hypothetical protein JXJ17_14945 [Anaerolineae bacterium]|nr:hypothetical protein [Anaerolineae bacterium]
MCGIFGIAVAEDYPTSAKQLERSIRGLFRLSESRGKEAAGLAIVRKDVIATFKAPVSASHMLASLDYQELIHNYIPLSSNGSNNCCPQVIIGHSRLVTNGLQTHHDNNQPVIANDIVAIHNGIIVNDELIWKKFPDLERQYEVDTEIIPTLLGWFLKKDVDIVQAAQKTFDNIEGATSTAVVFGELDHLLLATNNGSLYVMEYPGQVLVFASEAYILQQFKKQAANLLPKSVMPHTYQIRPGKGELVSLGNLKTLHFDLQVEDALQSATPMARSEISRSIHNIKPTGLGADKTAGLTLVTEVIIPQEVLDRVQYDHSPIDNLRRCTHCVLPETMTYIEFDEDGVCNYCHNYKKTTSLGMDALEALAEPYRSKDGSPDCLVCVSGGRDSTYGLHFVKTVLGMNPIAYTYDWGMVTDLARRNISRICGKLGVEHILVSADINKKRKNIQRNVNAWLRNPELGMVPLFMVGDKQYFYYGMKLQEQLGINLGFISGNRYEQTYFKSGFAGVMELTSTGKSGEWRSYNMPATRKLRILWYYVRQILQNPAYINPSLKDTIQGFYSAYVLNHNFKWLYDYIPWDEQEIMSTLRAEYDWEIANDTDTTWRIGDGTAAFYNYIYYTIAGLSEHDTFFSNMVREGMLTREEALEKVRTHNQPRYESIKWYCDVNGLDFEKTVQTINAADKLYDV